MRRNKIAMIFGITGQDGSYLSHYLLKKKFKVIGITRSKKKKNLENLNRFSIVNKIKLIKINSLNQKKIYKIIRKNNPTQIYYLAGQSSVSYSFIDPIEAYLSNNEILFYILETIRKQKKKIQIYNSVSSECFGNQKNPVCSEKSNFNPVSPYGKSKALSYWLSKYYRENYRLNVSNGILFNHESILRNKSFVTKKIINYYNTYEKDKKKNLYLGNINVVRDWGWANDYVEAIYKINPSKKNDDFIVGTGKSYSLLDFIKIIFKKKKIPLSKIKVSKKYKRPFEIKKIIANNKKIKRKLNWKPKLNFEDMAFKLVNNDLI